jgi:transglutaminase-like putative cysteine protease
VSRYLPVLGSFVQLRFTEPQQFRTSNALRLIALSREPASMKAFRIERMSSGSSFREPSPSTGSAVPRHLYMDTSGAAADRALWQRAVDEIVTEMRTKSAAEFARAATTWLQRRHAYALSNAIPPGPGDPLVRWTLSDQPGHCELFAGAFAMLARTAGYPARIVGGFFGGSWNGDFLVVRNSNAHAWCEIFDGESHWLRVDATAPVPEQNPTARQAAERQRGRLPIERGFAASLDRLRMLWYRRVVQFDRNDQLTMAQSLREKSASLGKQLRGWMQYAVDNARSWLARPWTGRRALNIALGVAAGAGLIWWWRAKGRAYWLNWRSRHTRGMDPIRQEAGKWLQRLQVERLRNEPANTPTPLEESLQRLRFGPRPTWPDPFAAFAEARSALRARRRARGKRRG